MSEETRIRMAHAYKACVDHLRNLVALRDNLVAQFKTWSPLDSENPSRIKEVRRSVTELRQTVADLGRAYQPAEDAYDETLGDGGIQSVGDVAVFGQPRSDAYRAVIDTVWLTLNTFRVQTSSPDPPHFPFDLLGLHGVRRVEDPFVELMTPDQIEYQLEAMVRIGLTASEVKALEKALDRQLQADDLDSVPTVVDIRFEHRNVATERRTGGRPQNTALREIILENPEADGKTIKREFMKRHPAKKTPSTATIRVLRGRMRREKLLDSPDAGQD